MPEQFDDMAARIELLEAHSENLISRMAETEKLLADHAELLVGTINASTRFVKTINGVLLDHKDRIEALEGGDG